MTDAKRERRTLWSVGQKGDLGWMRVLHDAKAERAVVKYKDGNGKPRKKLFEGDKKGRDRAVEWAQSFHNERQRLGATRTDTTHGQLWAAFLDSPAWRNLRATSHASYIDRWTKWENFRGVSTRPADTTLHSIDQFITRGREVWAINQVRQVLNIARRVYNWGFSRKLIAENAFAGYRWTTPKDVVEIEPEEFSPDEYLKILAQLSPQSSRTWRAHVAMMIAGHHGGRARAVLHLTETAIDGNDIVWPPAFQKNGKELRQPLTWDLVAALETARYWRRKMLYKGPWILFGGTWKSRGEHRELEPWMKDPKHGRVGAGVGKVRTIADQPYSYSGLLDMIHKASDAAGVPRKKWRGVHGLRKHAAGNVADATGDTRLAMEWIGDDIRQAPAYLKRRDERLQRAADAVQTGAPKESK